MVQKNLVYIGSLRNSAADKAGQYIEYKGTKRYMKSPLEYLIESLNTTPLGDLYSFEGLLFDDDESLPRDREKLTEYGFSYHKSKPWFYPAGLRVQGRLVEDITHFIPSAYRCHSMDVLEWVVGKSDFETRILDKLIALKADIILLGIATDSVLY